MASQCPGSADNSYGPVTSDDCRDGFDFTLLFEQTVLGILPALAFLVAVPARLMLLSRKRSKTILDRPRGVKLTAAISFFVVQLALLVLWNQERTTRITIAYATVNLAVAAEVVALTWIEDVRSVRPSSLLIAYLLFGILFDIAQARTLWLRQTATRTLPAVFTTSIGIKLALLLLEGRGKRSYLREEYQHLPPESTSSVINRSFLWWANRLFRKGLNAILTTDDLYDLDPRLKTAGLSEAVIAAWTQRRTPERRFEFAWAVSRALWRPFLAAVFPRICLIGFTFAQPFLIFRVIDLLSGPQDQRNKNRGYGLIGAAALIYLGLAVSSLHYKQAIYRFVTMFRGASVSLIYNHTLAIQDCLYDEAAAVTLMSTDVDGTVMTLVNLNECWARMVEVIVGVVLLARQLGWVSVIPVIVVILSFLGATQISKAIGPRQRVWIDAVQKRIAITSSVLADMKSVKMMGLSRLLTSIVQEQRIEETNRMAGFRWCNLWQNVVQNLPYILAPALTFTVYAAQAAAQGKASFSTTQAFTSLSIITLLTDPAAKLLSAIPNTASSIGCFDRIQEFLVSNKREDRRQTNNASGLPPSSTLPAILADNVDLRPHPPTRVLLKSLTFTVPRGALSMIIGPVGSGKSTLLRAILGEVPPENGAITVCSTRISYCAQVPWLPNKTIQQAICGPSVSDGLDFDHEWYQTVIEACDLSRDFSNFAEGDHTRIGSGGAVLSGGQRHRVALARALYARAEISLLDDILSALDANTKRIVVERVFGKTGLLRKIGTTCLLATHSAEYLSYADTIYLIADGGIKHQATYDQAVREGIIAAVSTWGNVEKTNVESEADHTKSESKEAANVSDGTDELADLTRATGDFAVYGYYFRSVGWLYMAIFVGSVLLNVFCETFSIIWLKWWTDIEGQQIMLYISIFLALALMTVVGLFGYIWAMNILITPSTARSFHAVLLETVMRAPQLFFSVTDTGTILNRFSQDMTLIEGSLPTGVLVTVSNFFMSIASAALVATGSSYMAVSVPFLIGTIIVLQHVYLRTSRQLRLLDLEAKSPLYTHFLETLNGLATIRAISWDQRFKEENHRLLDISQRPYYLLHCVQRWLGLVLDLIVGAEAVLVVGLAVGLRSSTQPGLLGVSLNHILSLSGNLASLVSGWTLFETSLGAIARLKSFEATIKPEDKPGETSEPPPGWPAHGSIEFSNVTASHNPTAVGIRDVSLEVKSGQKVGICGRTGSGKSSLIATILRLLEIDSGAIKVDGVDLATIPRDIIRDRLIAIPQDPLILAGFSVRLNVDPRKANSDEEIIAALQRVGLWSVLCDRPGVLDAEMTGDFLSRGQQQLFALARAILGKRGRERGIVLLDEMMSSVDMDTDAVMQCVLKEDFTEWTTITVAHRLESIMTSDMVIVMEDGRVAEVGEPNMLMANESRFKSLAGGR